MLKPTKQCLISFEHGTRNFWVLRTCISKAYIIISEPMNLVGLISHLCLTSVRLQHLLIRVISPIYVVIQFGCFVKTLCYANFGRACLQKFIQNLLQEVPIVIVDILSHCVGVSKETVGLYSSYHRVITTRLSPGCEVRYQV